MSSLWGDDDMQWGAYLQWKRRMPIWPWIVLILAMIVASWVIWVVIDAKP